MTVPTILFGIAALLGVTLAVQRFRGSPQPSLSLALVHGGVAAAGLLGLLGVVLEGEAPGLATTALILFVVAAVGGFVLLATHMRKKALSLALMLVHGGVAATAFVLLLLALSSG